MDRRGALGVALFLLVAATVTVSQKEDERITLAETGIRVIPPKTWKSGVAGNFPYVPGDFIAGWRRPTGFGYAAIIVASQKPPQPLTREVYVQLMTKVLTERFAAQDVVANSEVDFPFGRTAWVSGTAPGIGMNLGGGEILTRALWIAYPADPHLLIFYFSCPTPAYADLIDDFKAFVETVQLPPRLARPAPDRTSYKEASLLNPEQWQALERIAREEGTDVGALLRKIVDDFLKTRLSVRGQ